MPAARSVACGPAFCAPATAADPRGLRVRCTLPADTTALVLSVRALGELRTGSVTRAVWLTPALYDPVRADRTAAPSTGR